MAKTLRSRIAAVAVAALGAGLLSAAPASAAVSTARTVKVAASTSYASTATITGGRVGAAVTANVAISTTTDVTAAETITITPSVVSAPTGSAVSVGTAGAGKAGLTNSGAAGTTTAGSATTDKWTLAVSSGVSTLAWSAGTIAAASDEKVGTLSLTADVQGKYVVKLAITSNNGTGTNTDATVTFYVSDLYATTADGLTSGTSKNTSVNGVAGPANTVTLAAVQQGTTTRLVTVTGGTISTVGTNLTLAADKASAVLAVGSAGSTTNSTFTVLTPSTGTITVKIFEESQSGIYSTTALATVTVTVLSASGDGLLDADSSTATMTKVGTGVLSTDALSITSPRTAGNRVADIQVQLYASTGTLPATTKTTMTITGPGYLVVTNGGTNSTGRSISDTGDFDFNVGVYGDGTSGVATVTITTGSFTATRTVTFYGSVASYSVTAKNAYLAAGVTDAQILTVKALDSAGIAVPSATIYASSSSTAIATVSNSTVTTGSDAAAADLGATGVGKGVATITLANAASSATVTATYTLNVVKAGIASVALSFDKASYAPGEKATVTVTAKNADGSFVGDAAYTAFFTSAGLTSSAYLTTDTSGASVTTVSGVKTYTVYMPLTAGAVTVNATLGADVAEAIQATKVSATANVVADTSTIDAVKAQVAALSTTITSMQTAISTLVASTTATLTLIQSQINKIMKKLKIK